MKVKKLSCILLTVALLVSVTAALLAGSIVRAEEAPAASEPLSVEVQNKTVILDELNAFVAYGTDGGDIEYQIAADGGAFETVKTSKEIYVAYRCKALGDFKVRVVNGGKASDAVAFKVVEDGGAVFGSSPDGDKPTHNIDFTYDTEESRAIEHKSVGKISDEYAFVKNVKTDKFLLTATIDILGNNYNDRNPKVGLFAKSGKNMYYFAFDVKPDFRGDTAVFVSYDPSNGWKWGQSTAYNITARFRSGETRVPHTLSVLREGENFWFYVDFEFVGKATVAGLTAQTVVGTYTMAQNALYSECSCFVGGTPEYEQFLAEAKTH